ncbi:MAG TPA: hypothetical protein VHG28_03235 [Longimicrobiaceae bacterium]|nr:hypothetical protein [Longimicrobiaceae bacterium]
MRTFSWIHTHRRAFLTTCAAVYSLAVVESAYFSPGERLASAAGAALMAPLSAVLLYFVLRLQRVVNPRFGGRLRSAFCAFFLFVGGGLAVVWVLVYPFRRGDAVGGNSPATFFLGAPVAAYLFWRRDVLGPGPRG